MVFSKRPPPGRWSLWAACARPRSCGKPSGEIAVPWGLPHLRQDSRALLLSGVGIIPPPLGKVTCPVVHQDTPALEQVRARIGRLHPVPDHMRQGRLDHLPGMVRLQLFGNTGHGPVPRRRGDESEQETGSPNGREMIDDFRLWGSSRCRRMGVTLSEGGG